MSWKPCSSNRLASHVADSTRASGVALPPYFASIRGSSEPALTPIRIGVPWSFAARAISLTWSSNFLILPGFTRTAAQPASIAANTYFGWKWICLLYTSDAADEEDSVDLGGRRIIKKKK